MNITPTPDERWAHVATLTAEQRMEFDQLFPDFQESPALGMPERDYDMSPESQQQFAIAFRATHADADVTFQTAWAKRGREVRTSTLAEALYAERQRVAGERWNEQLRRMVAGPLCAVCGEPSEKLTAPVGLAGRVVPLCSRCRTFVDQELTRRAGEELLADGRTRGDACAELVEALLVPAPA